MKRTPITTATVSDAIFATIDFIPTFANLAGFSVPDDRQIDGVDQTDLLWGERRKGARTAFVYLNNAVRQSRWKYLRAEHDVPGYARDTKREPVEELYDLEADIGERKNLAAEHPGKVRKLKKLLDGLCAIKSRLVEEEGGQLLTSSLFLGAGPPPRMSDGGLWRILAVPVNSA